MNVRKKFFLVLIFINAVILIYTAYCARVFDYEWCGYTFVGVFLWTVGIIMVTPPDRPIKWYTTEKLLSYPLLSLIVFVVIFYTSGLFDFLLKAIVLFVLGELLVYALQKKLSKEIALVYYSILMILAWVLLYKYPLIALSYSLFAVYCAMNLLQLTNGNDGESIERAS
ncbi:hypothetical protein [Thermococcus sp. 21S9]|uniref:hypothetical protein n=1 Tax=Thermococcus sp. 21S9 TaxID=1638223 RepID=UPI001439EC19|nr:hypothetical protein [Thermococcus sp. 21S9]NJE54350.1 hypothetical protein [Thermococcus sp. 21S9]